MSSSNKKIYIGDTTYFLNTNGLDQWRWSIVNHIKKKNVFVPKKKKK